MRVITESEFAARMAELVADGAGWVTGPGRSGAIAAVYASHILGIPFVPYGSGAAAELGRVLIVDTARASGRTLRKAERRYQDHDPIIWVAFEEPPRVVFWYDGRCMHERMTACRN